MDLLTGVSGRLGKVPDEVVPADLPSTTQAKEAEQVPELDGMNLHRRGRHAARATGISVGGLASGEGVDWAHLPAEFQGIFGGRDGLHPGRSGPSLRPKSKSAARSRRLMRWLDARTKGSLMPLLAIDFTLGRSLTPVDRLPDELLAVIDRHVEIKLLVKLALPLGQ